MPERDSLLERQLKRHFPDNHVPEALKPLLNDVAEAYLQFDADRGMLQRSLDLSSQELLQANAALRALVSAFPDQLIRLDSSGVVLDVRGGSVRHLAKRWVVGKPLVQQLPKEARALAPAIDAVLHSRTAASVEVELRQGPIARVYEARLFPIDATQILVILRDVTERHFAEEQLKASQIALQQAHRELERRVEERTAALAHANQELRKEINERHAAENERRRLEEELRHAQKMEAVGRLAGGIAHDFNNLLTAVQGYAELLLKALGDSPLRADVEEIYRAAERAAVLTRQLLAFSRRQILQPETLDLNARVLEMSRMLGRLIGEHIAIDLQLSPDACTVRADAAQLEQAIVNLGVNARDAMQEGGRLAIATSNRELSAADAGALGLQPGPYVTLLVCDSGTGIPHDIKPRIFDPFFTTKPQGQGTGLGLAMVYGFVRQSGGAVTVESEPGRGSVFTLFLPRGTAVSPRATADKPVAPQTRGSGTILIAEDERPIRRLVATVLQQAGYETLEAADGQEALEIFAKHPQLISMVITDVVMPRIGGRQLAQHVRGLRRDLPLLYMTGYAEEGDALRQTAPDAFVLLKPFSPDTLLHAVASVRPAPHSRT
jgi:signal transduction histidine kinase/ActR/RegA family two-component response regulator